MPEPTVRLPAIGKQVVFAEGTEKLAVHMMSLCIAEMIAPVAEEYGAAMMRVEQLRGMPDAALHMTSLHRKPEESPLRQQMMESVETVSKTLGRDTIFALRLYAETEAHFIRAAEGLIATSFYQKRYKESLDISHPSRKICYTSTLGDLRRAYGGIAACYASCIEKTIALLPEKPPLRVSIERLVTRYIDALIGLLLTKILIEVYKNDLHAKVHGGDPFGVLAHAKEHRDAVVDELIKNKLQKLGEFFEHVGKPFVNHTSMIEFYRMHLMLALCVADYQTGREMVDKLKEYDPVDSAQVISRNSELINTFDPPN